MSEPFIGQLRLVAFNFAPRGYALCNGQLLAIRQNAALFSLLGTFYGGDGIQTFALPNLQSRVAVSSGSSMVLGEVGGTETVSLLTTQIPAHTHTLTASTSTTQLKTLAGNTVGNGKDATALPYSTSVDGTMAPSALAPAGSSQAHENRAPYLVLNWVIALTGIFPSRN
jgi:microcystin-dependent protein